MYTMPYLLAPSPSPPPSSRFLSSESSPASSASSKLGGSSSCTPSTAPTSPLPPRKTQGGRSGTIIDAEEDPDILPKMPTLSLDVNAISDVMAARLTTCLIGHVLYLKSQVPLFVFSEIFLAHGILINVRYLVLWLNYPKCPHVWCVSL